MLARFAENSPNTVVAALPSATVGWHDGNSTFRYRMASMMPGPEQADEAAARNWMPQLSLRDGDLAIEHGLHQEFGWERRTETSGMAVLVYGDNIDNPVMQAMGHFAGGNSGPVPQLLYDPTSGLMHAAGPNFTSAGMLASVDHRLPGGNQVRLSYANGNALTMGETTAPVGLTRIAGFSPSELRAELLHQSLRHAGWERDPLAGELSLAAGRHVYQRCAVCVECRAALPQHSTAAAAALAQRWNGRFAGADRFAQPARAGLPGPIF